MDNIDAIALLDFLNLNYPNDGIFQRAFGNEYMRRKMYPEAKASFDRYVNIMMTNTGAMSVKDITFHLYCDECHKTDWRASLQMR